MGEGRLIIEKSGEEVDLSRLTAEEKERYALELIKRAIAAMGRKHSTFVKK